MIKFAIAITCVIAGNLHAATTQPFRIEIDRESAHLERVIDQIKPHAKLASSPYIRLDLAVARRFIDRVNHLDAKRKQAPQWTKEQMDEVGEVLAHAQRTIELVASGKLPEDGLGPVPLPVGGTVQIRDGVFVTPTRAQGESQPTTRPFYFGGYGHFQQIVDDLPNFPALGVSLVQDGRNGPKQGLNPDLSLTPAGKEIAVMLAKAAKASVKVDILISPHYFPDWAVAAAPDMQNGSAFHNIDHPKQREVIEAWLSKVGAMNKNEPALMSYCLSNEPAYSASGRDKFSAPAWHAFLEKRHKTIAALNELYATKFKSFEEVPADGWDDSVPGRRRAYDWVCFNDQHFADWHKWMGEALKKRDPRALTHAKIMIFFALDNDKAGWGIDPECFADATDIAGCDAYMQHDRGTGPLDESAPKEYAYHWQVQELCYDLLHSFRGQPVFNSENHPLPNAFGWGKIPAAHTRAALWQGGLHHQGAQTTWVWEEASEDSLLDSIYFRPANIAAAGRAMLDLNRLGDEVTAINRAAPTVGILYSPASIFWEKDYAKGVRTVYTALTFLGENVTFVSERQLAENRVPAFKAIVAAHATHVTDETYRALTSANPAGRKIILFGGDHFGADEYGRTRTRSEPERAAVITSDLDEHAVGAKLRDILADRPPAGSLIVGGTPAWGIEFRTVAYKGGYLVPMMNLMKDSQRVTLKIDGTSAEAVDLLTRQIVSTTGIELDPMAPLLLRVERK